MKENNVHDQSQTKGEKQRFSKGVIIALILSVALVVAAAAVIVTAVLLRKPANPGSNEEGTTVSQPSPVTETAGLQSATTDERQSGDPDTPRTSDVGGDVEYRSYFTPTVETYDNWHAEVRRHVSTSAECNPDAPPEATFEFDGVKYKGSYAGISMRSCSYDRGSDIYVCYTDDAEECGIYAYIERGTGVLRAVTLDYPYVFTPDNGTPENAADYAKEIASEYIDTDAYSMRFIDHSYEYDDIAPYFTEIPVCVYVFEKKIGSIGTNDRLFVEVWENGMVWRVAMSDIGRYDAIESEPEFNEKSLDESIREP